MKSSTTIVGHAAYDYIFNVAKHPTDNRSSYIDSWKRYYGGGAANIAVGIAQLGGTCRLYTMAGTDFRRYENYLRKKGVTLVLVRGKKKTARAYIFNASGRQRMYFSWGVSDEMSNLPGISSAHLHIAPCHPALALKMSDRAKFFAFEPGHDLQKFDNSSLSYLIEHADVIFFNETELSLVKKRVSLQGKNVIVTLGRKGSLIYSTGEKIPVVSPQRVVDATGAGDAYKAGFWRVYAETNDIVSACRMGTTVASFIVEKPGAQGFPSNEKLLRRYRKHFG